MKHKKDWFYVSGEFDDLCFRKYGTYFEDTELLGDSKNPDEILGKIILLDQISRNIFRGTAKAYSYDNKACMLMLNHFHISNELDGWKKIFFLMPFKHSENIHNQEYNIKLWNSIIDSTFDISLEKLYLKNLETCKKHYKIIKKFKRFPKRNYILNRNTTEKEEIYLLENPHGFI